MSQSTLCHPLCPSNYPQVADEGSEAGKVGGRQAGLYFIAVQYSTIHVNMVELGVGGEEWNGYIIACDSQVLSCLCVTGHLRLVPLGWSYLCRCRPLQMEDLGTDNCLNWKAVAVQ